MLNYFALNDTIFVSDIYAERSLKIPFRRTLCDHHFQEVAIPLPALESVKHCHGSIACRTVC